MSQRRETFRLDAASMGLTASKSNSSFSEDQNECKCTQLDEEQEQEQSSVASSCVDGNMSAQPSLFSHSPGCSNQQQQQQADAPPSLTSPDSFCRSNMETIPTEHYRKELDKLRRICGDAAAANYELNGIFIKRLEGIDALGQQAGDSSVSRWGNAINVLTFNNARSSFIYRVNYVWSPFRIGWISCCMSIMLFSTICPIWKRNRMPRS